MVPSAQRLATRDAHRLHADDRLIDDAQRLRLDRRTQVGLHQLPVPESGIHGRLEQPPVVLAEFLCLVERQIGLHDHRIDLGVPDARQDGAAACLDAQRVAGDVHIPLQPRKDLVEDGHEMALILEAIDEDDELVAAEAADLDRVAGKGGKPFGDGVDQAVADRVAERIVDALEIVEVEHRQAAEAVAVAGRHRFGDDLVEIARGWAGPVRLS